MYFDILYFDYHYIIISITIVILLLLSLLMLIHRIISNSVANRTEMQTISVGNLVGSIYTSLGYT